MELKEIYSRKKAIKKRNGLKVTQWGLSNHFFTGSFGGDDLQPVAVGVFDEVNSHICIFKADTAHLPVLRKSGVKIIYRKCKVDLVVAQLIGAVHVPQPGQLQQMRGGLVA